MSFPVLSDSAYVDYVGDMSTKGANSTTHLASIRYPVQRAPVISVVKLMPTDGLAWCNEAIGWLFQRAAGMMHPRQAALLQMTERKARSVLAPRRLPAALFENGHALAWAAEQLPYKSLQVLFAGQNAEARWLQCLCTVQGAAIAAFDEAFLNIDRNLGNVLFARGPVVVAIDHEQICGLQNWQTGPISPQGLQSDSLGRLQRALQGRQLPIAAYEQARNQMVHHADKHAAALNACQSEITDLLVKIFQDAGRQKAERVLSFLQVRTMRDWMADRLGAV